MRFNFRVVAFVKYVLIFVFLLFCTQFFDFSLEFFFFERTLRYLFAPSPPPHTMLTNQNPEKSTRFSSKKCGGITIRKKKVYTSSKSLKKKKNFCIVKEKTWNSTNEGGKFLSLKKEIRHEKFIKKNKRKVESQFLKLCFCLHSSESVQNTHKHFLDIWYWKLNHVKWTFWSSFSQ